MTLDYLLRAFLVGTFVIVNCVWVMAALAINRRDIETHPVLKLVRYGGWAIGFAWAALFTGLLVLDPS